MLYHSQCHPSDRWRTPTPPPPPVTNSFTHLLNNRSNKVRILANALSFLYVLCALPCYAIHSVTHLPIVSRHLFDVPKVTSSLAKEGKKELKIPFLCVIFPHLNYSCYEGHVALFTAQTVNCGNYAGQIVVSCFDLREKHTNAIPKISLTSLRSSLTLTSQ